MGDYTRANFSALNVGSQDFQAVFKAVHGTVGDLNSDLKSLLGAWVGDANSEYGQYFSAWNGAADHMALVLNKLGDVIGYAHGNYTATEKKNANLWA